MNNDRQLSASEIRQLLSDLADDLHRRGIEGELYLVGGAAIALAYDGRRITRDLDGFFVPKTEIYDAARQVAERNGLPEDWLNDAVKGLIPGTDPNSTVVFDEPGLRVSVPSPKHLLAMKVSSARADRDVDDIILLAKLCGYDTSRQILDATLDVWLRPNLLTPKSSFLVQELFGPLEPEPPASPSQADLHGIDSDNDGLSDALEREIGTNPHNPDTDGDGLHDGYEYTHVGHNPRDGQLHAPFIPGWVDPPMAPYPTATSTAKAFFPEELEPPLKYHGPSVE